MRAIHLVLTALLLVVFVGGLWIFLGAEPGTVRASTTSTDVAERGGADSIDANSIASSAGSDGSRAAAVDAAAIAKPDASIAAKKDAKRKLLGRVVDPSGAPVEGARVWAAKSAEWYASLPIDLEPEAVPRGWMKIRDTLTAADGTFAFEEMEKGALSLAVRAHGFAPRYENRWSVRGDDEERLPDVALSPGVVLAGRVVDRGGEGVAGVAILSAVGRVAGASDVAMPGRGIPLATTAADGAFTIDVLAPGPYELILDAPGYVVSEERGRTERAGERVASLRFVLEPGLDVAGRVRSPSALPAGLRVSARAAAEPKRGERNDDAADPGEPGDLPDARSARARHASCDAEGSFVLRGLEPGKSYRLSVTEPGAEPGTWKRVSAVEGVVVQAGQRNVELAWKPQASIDLRVVDATTREPITELEAWCGVGRERSVRDEKGEVQKRFADGRVHCAELRPQAGKLVLMRVRAPGHRDWTNANVTIVEGQALDLGEIALEREHALVVHVVDDASGAPVANARVMVSTQDEDVLRSALESDPARDLGGDPKTWSARTDEHGVARATGAPGRSVVVGAQAAGFLATEPLRVGLPPDADHELELRMRRGAAVVVSVRDASGRPVKGVGIAHRRPEKAEAERGWQGLSAEKKSDADGVARFEHLCPGVHGFCLHDEAGEVWINPEDAAAAQPAWVERALVEGATVELAFVAPPRGRISGRIREGGRPLEGAQLRLARVREGEAGEVDPWNGPQDPTTTTTDHEGLYRYEDVRCGEYVLIVHHASRRMGARMRVQIAEEPRTYDFDLDAASIEGRVTDPEGEPIAGVEISVVAVSSEVADDAPYQLVVREDERGNARMDYRQGTRSSVRTDARGAYVLRGVATGTPLIVSAQSDAVEAGNTGELTLSPDEVKRNVDFKLRRAGSVQVMLGGTPPRQDAWYEVRAVRIEGEAENVVQSTWIGAWNKTTTLRGLAPGGYRIVLAKPGRDGGGTGDAPPSQAVDVRPSETATVVLQAY